MPSSIFAPGILAHRVAVITGGGTGLGLATAHELVSCGATVVIVGRRQEILSAARKELSAEGPDRVDAVRADIREPGAAAAIVSEVLERHGRLDVLVNNAGGQYFVPAEGITAKGWRAVMRLNVEGTRAMSIAARDLAMAPAGRGTIVNVTLSPHHGLAGMTHSSAARAAVEALTRQWAREWEPDGIAVSCVAVGHFLTDALSKYPEPVRAGAARTVPLGRLGDPKEHAWLVALLSSNLGRAMSGAIVTIDGARDNWYGPWPPPGLADDAGEVPTEERRPAPAS